MRRHRAARSMMITVYICKWCGLSIIQCPTLCTFHGWKHMSDGKHGCYRRLGKAQLYAFPLTMKE